MPSKSKGADDGFGLAAIAVAQPKRRHRAPVPPEHGMAVELMHRARAEMDPLESRKLLSRAASLELRILSSVRKQPMRTWVAETAARAALAAGEDELLVRSVREGTADLDPESSRYWSLSRLSALGGALQLLDALDRSAIDWAQLDLEREDLVDLAIVYRGRLIEFSFDDALDEVKAFPQEPGRLRIELPLLPKAEEILKAIATPDLRVDRG